MKLIKQDNGRWSITDLTAEQVLDINEMVGIKYGLEGMTKRANAPTSNGRKHKKHMFPKTCSRCGKTFRGIKGLGTHMGHKHKLLPSVKALEPHEASDIPAPHN